MDKFVQFSHTYGTNKDGRFMTEIEILDQNHLSSQNHLKKGQLPGRVLMAFAALFALLALLGWGLMNARAGPVDNGPAPHFDLVSFDGREVALSSLRGQVVVINFWASWCNPCREEADYLEQTWRKYQDDGVVFIGIDYADTEKEALAYIDEFDITYFNGPDLGTRISQAYNIQGVPETFFVDKRGNLRGVKIGPLKAPELDNKIEELLAEPYPAQ
ncbi:MAG: TlpA family protein disulfide reductase [Chloroflexota bacterium]|nr:MAG: TlpA family protein disulfide reductase [Chloroflexota bacterium]